MYSSRHNFEKIIDILLKWVLPVIGVVFTFGFWILGILKQEYFDNSSMCGDDAVIVTSNDF